MAKVTIQTIANLDNPPTVVAQVNYNFNALQTVIETLLSRDGALPNSMLANLDMNGNRVVNLPVPVSPTEPARHGDIQQYVDEAEDWAEEAEEQADRAEAEADDAEQSAEDAADSLLDLVSRYVGAYATAPTLDPNGAPLVVGAMYYNTTVNQINIFALDDVHANGDPVYVGDIPVLVGYWIPVPIENYDGLNDVDMTSLDSGQIAVWSGTLWEPADLSAENVSFTPDVLDGNTVQEAIDDLVARTSLGVYDVSFWIQGLMEGGERVFRMTAARAFTIPVGATGSVARARIGPTAGTAIVLSKNGVQFGTVNFATSATTGTFTVAGEQSFASGDTLEINGPAVSDSAFRDISITLACRR